MSLQRYEESHTFGFVLLHNPKTTEDLTMALLFENETCGRCGGTGKHSFNQIDGDRCYGCSGSGRRLTKRGHAAMNFYLRNQERLGTDVQVGEYFYWDGWKKVVQIKPDGLNGVIYLHSKSAMYGIREDQTLRSVKDEADRTAQVAAALAYQATLTKTGVPSKKALKAQQVPA